MMYKRRWFLRLEEFRLLIARSVATIAPMKRGLKGVDEMASPPRHLSSNHCPDEKGTESGVGGHMHLTYCPDEKGTESIPGIRT